jgi:hypothetical protein
LVPESGQQLQPLFQQWLTAWSPGWTGVFEVWCRKCKFIPIRKEAAQKMSSILFLVFSTYRKLLFQRE